MLVLGASDENHAALHGVVLFRDPRQRQAALRPSTFNRLADAHAIGNVSPIAGAARRLGEIRFTVLLKDAAQIAPTST